ncbi:MAG: DUF1579 family protein [Acidimicrobiia bacterium]
MTTPASDPCTGPESTQLDFWLGGWDLTWPAEQSGGAAGEISHGTNQVEKILGGCVIEERFATADGEFLGRSHSVFDTEAGVWRQTWVDSTGGYLVFTGGVNGSDFELRTEPAERNGVIVVNRMVFRDIRRDSLTWCWQASTNDGKSWDEWWTIGYRRQGTSPGGDSG